MIFESSIIVGFVRLCLMVLVLYYLNSLLVRKTPSQTLLQFLVNQWFKYGSVSMILLFALIEIGIYNLINFLLVLFLVIIIDYIGFENCKRPLKFIKTITSDLFHKIIVLVDEKKSIRTLFKVDINIENSKEKVFIFWLIIILIPLAFIGRFYFYTYDTYLFSDLWISDLGKIIAFDNQSWFTNEIIIDGELALANLYGKLTNVSPEVSLQSMAILESVLLSLVVFWTVRKITLSKIFAPLMAFFSFIFLYTISPIEIHYLLQNQPILLSLSLTLPAMVFTMKPDSLGSKKWNYFLSFLACYIAIGLLDVFTLLIIIPPFYIVLLLFFNKKQLVFQVLSLIAFVSGTAIILFLYYLYCQAYLIDFQIFLQSSLISVHSFTYMPNIYIPFEQLLTYYQYGSFFSLLVLPLFIWLKKEDWKNSLVMIIYFNILVALYFIHITWIDNDLMRYALAVFIPILFGITISIFVRLLFPIYKVFFQRKYLLYTVSGILSLVIILYSQKTIFEDINSTDKTPRMVLKAYDHIFHEYFPYSYAVVNDNIAQTLSTNKHYFMNYSDFLMNYLESDSVYHANRKDPKFAIERPDQIIPKSILVFTFNSESKESKNYFSDQGDIEFLLNEQLSELKKRGRKIEVIYESPYVKVFEIINEPKSSRIRDLIF